MKKILLALIAMVACTTINAKVVKITLKDKTMQVYTSTQLSAIDFNDNGTVTITSYDGNVLMKDAEVDDVNITEEEAITTVTAKTMQFNLATFTALAALKDGDLGGLAAANENPEIIGSRDVHQINFVYPTLDPYGEPITMSGVMWIPDEIWNAELNSEGLILFNYFSTTNRNLLPSAKDSDASFEPMFLANPLKPNYIIVESDLYGWGATDRFPACFLQGDANGRANIDCLLAARRLLSKLSIHPGILNFNVGYSAGGFEALAAQKVRDRDFRYEVCFDKTFVGGAASDLKLAYRGMVECDQMGLTGMLPAWMVSTNEIQKLGLDYNQLFQPTISPFIAQAVLSKRYNPYALSFMVGWNSKVHEILGDTYCDLESPESKYMQDVMESMNLANDWLPNPTQRLYILHSCADDIVPVQAGRALLPFLKANGYEPSIIPGATTLQTNFVISETHMGALPYYFIQTMAAIVAWPYMYYHGELNAAYKFLVDQTKNDPIALLRYFDSIGFDCRSMIKALLALNPTTMPYFKIEEETLEADLTIICEQMGITYEDLCQMMEDSGIDLKTFVIELVRYINENPEQDIFKGDIRTLRSSNDQVNPVEEYENQLYDWLKANGLNMDK